MKEAIDPRRVVAILHYSKRVDEEKHHLRIAKTIPLDIPIHLTVKYTVDGFSQPAIETYIIYVKEIHRDIIHIELLALEEVSVYVQPLPKFIPISFIVAWKKWEVVDAAKTINYEYLSDKYKAMAFVK